MRFTIILQFLGVATTFEVSHKMEYKSIISWVLAVCFFYILSAYHELKRNILCHHQRFVVSDVFLSPKLNNSFWYLIKLHYDKCFSFKIRNESLKAMDTFDMENIILRYISGYVE